MITTESISSWLKEPHLLQEIAPKALTQFVKEYPYFVPGHYLKYIVAGENTDSLFALQQAYPVHPVLWHCLYKAAQQQDLTVVQKTGKNDNARMNDRVMPAPGDYFAQQEIEAEFVMSDFKAGIRESKKMQEEAPPEEEKSLLVMMSFAEWLQYMQRKNNKEKEEVAAQKALKTMWQKQKLAAAIEEEDEEIPETVFEMAVNSISRNDEWISESLAEVYLKQGKKSQALEVYRKLSLLNPEKNTYFAAKIEHLQKDLEV